MEQKPVPQKQKPAPVQTPVTPQQKPAPAQAPAVPKPAPGQQAPVQQLPAQKPAVPQAVPQQAPVLDPVLNTFFIYQALKGNPQQYPVDGSSKLFLSQFEAFKAKLVTDPKIKGLVIAQTDAAVRLSAEKGAVEFHGRDFANMVVQVGLKEAIQKANDFWQRIGNALGVKYPVIQGDILSLDTGTQGRFMFYVQQGVFKGWDVWVSESEQLVQVYEDEAKLKQVTREAFLTEQAFQGKSIDLTDPQVQKQFQQFEAGLSRDPTVSGAVNGLIGARLREGYEATEGLFEKIAQYISQPEYRVEVIEFAKRLKYLMAYRGRVEDIDNAETYQSPISLDDNRDRGLINGLLIHLLISRDAGEASLAVERSLVLMKHQDFLLYLAPLLNEDRVVLDDTKLTQEEKNEQLEVPGTIGYWATEGIKDVAGWEPTEEARRTFLKTFFSSVITNRANKDFMEIVLQKSVAHDEAVLADQNLNKEEKKERLEVPGLEAHWGAHRAHLQLHNGLSEAEADRLLNLRFHEMARVVGGKWIPEGATQEIIHEGFLELLNRLYDADPNQYYSLIGDIVARRLPEREYINKQDDDQIYDYLVYVDEHFKKELGEAMHVNEDIFIATEMLYRHGTEGAVRTDLDHLITTLKTDIPWQSNTFIRDIFRILYGQPLLERSPYLEAQLRKRLENAPMELRDDYAVMIEQDILDHAEDATFLSYFVLQRKLGTPLEQVFDRLISLTEQHTNQKETFEELRRLTAELFGNPEVAQNLPPKTLLRLYLMYPQLRRNYQESHAGHLNHSIPPQELFALAKIEDKYGASIEGIKRLYQERHPEGDASKIKQMAFLETIGKLAEDAKLQGVYRKEQKRNGELKPLYHMLQLGEKLSALREKGGRMDEKVAINIETRTSYIYMIQGLFAGMLALWFFGKSVLTLLRHFLKKFLGRNPPPPAASPTAPPAGPGISSGPARSEARSVIHRPRGVEPRDATAGEKLAAIGGVVLFGAGLVTMIFSILAVNMAIPGAGLLASPAAVFAFLKPFVLMKVLSGISMGVGTTLFLRGITRPHQKLIPHEEIKDKEGNEIVTQKEFDRLIELFRKKVARRYGANSAEAQDPIGAMIKENLKTPIRAYTFIATVFSATFIATAFYGSIPSWFIANTIIIGLSVFLYPFLVFNIAMLAYWSIYSVLVKARYLMVDPEIMENGLTEDFKHVHFPVVTFPSDLKGSPENVQAKKREIEEAVRGAYNTFAENFDPNQVVAILGAKRPKDVMNYIQEVIEHYREQFRNEFPEYADSAENFGFLTVADTNRLKTGGYHKGLYGALMGKNQHLAYVGAEYGQHGANYGTGPTDASLRGKHEIFYRNYEDGTATPSQSFIDRILAIGASEKPFVHFSVRDVDNQSPPYPVLAFQDQLVHLISKYPTDAYKPKLIELLKKVNRVDQMIGRARKLAKQVKENPDQHPSRIRNDELRNLVEQINQLKGGRATKIEYWPGGYMRLANAKLVANPFVGLIQGRLTVYNAGNNLFNFEEFVARELLSPPQQAFNDILGRFSFFGKDSAADSVLYMLFVIFPERLYLDNLSHDHFESPWIKPYYDESVIMTEESVSNAGSQYIQHVRWYGGDHKNIDVHHPALGDLTLAARKSYYSYRRIKTRELPRTLVDAEQSLKSATKKMGGTATTSSPGLNRLIRYGHKLDQADFQNRLAEEMFRIPALLGDFEQALTGAIDPALQNLIANVSSTPGDAVKKADSIYKNVSGEIDRLIAQIDRDFPRANRSVPAALLKVRADLQNIAFNLSEATPPKKLPVFHNDERPSFASTFLIHMIIPGFITNLAFGLYLAVLMAFAPVPLAEEQALSYLAYLYLVGTLTALLTSAKLPRPIKYVLTVPIMMLRAVLDVASMITAGLNSKLIYGLSYLMPSKKLKEPMRIYSMRPEVPFNWYVRKIVFALIMAPFLVLWSIWETIFSTSKLLKHIWSENEKQWVAKRDADIKGKAGWVGQKIVDDLLKVVSMSKLYGQQKGAPIAFGILLSYAYLTYSYFGTQYGAWQLAVATIFFSLLLGSSIDYVQSKKLTLTFPFGWFIALAVYLFSPPGIQLQIPERIQPDVRPWYRIIIELPGKLLTSLRNDEGLARVTLKPSDTGSQLREDWFQKKHPILAFLKNHSRVLLGFSIFTVIAFMRMTGYVPHSISSMVALTMVFGLIYAALPTIATLIGEIGKLKLPTRTFNLARIAVYAGIFSLFISLPSAWSFIQEAPSRVESAIEEGSMRKLGLEPGYVFLLTSAETYFPGKGLRGAQIPEEKVLEWQYKNRPPPQNGLQDADMDRKLEKMIQEGASKEGGANRSEVREQELRSFRVIGKGMEGQREREEVLKLIERAEGEQDKVISAKGNEKYKKYLAKIADYNLKVIHNIEGYNHLIQADVYVVDERLQDMRGPPAFLWYDTPDHFALGVSYQSDPAKRRAVYISKTALDRLIDRDAPLSEAANFLNFLASPFVADEERKSRVLFRTSVPLFVSMAPGPAEYFGFLFAELSSVLRVDMSDSNGRAVLMDAFLEMGVNRGSSEAIRIETGRFIFRGTPHPLEKTVLIRHLISGTPLSMDQLVDEMKKVDPAVIRLNEHYFGDAIHEAFRKLSTEEYQNYRAAFLFFYDHYKSLVHDRVSIRVFDERGEIYGPFPSESRAETEERTRQMVHGLKERLAAKGLSSSQVTGIDEIMSPLLAEARMRAKGPNHKEMMRSLRKLDPHAAGEVLTDYFRERVQNTRVIDPATGEDPEFNAIFTGPSGENIFSDRATMNAIRSLTSTVDESHQLLKDKIRAYFNAFPEGRAVPYRVIIIGTGSGVLAGELAAEFGEQIQIIESDIETANLGDSYLIHMEEGRHRRVQVIPYNAGDLLANVPEDQRRNSVDLVISFGALRYFADRVGAQTAESINSILAPNGIVLIGDMPDSEEAHIIPNFSGHLEKAGLFAEEASREHVKAARLTTFYNLRAQYGNAGNQSDLHTFFRQSVNRLAKEAGKSPDEILLFDLAGFKSGTVRLIVAAKNPVVTEQVAQTALKRSEARSRRKQPKVIAITGESGAGKSALAARVASELGAFNLSVGTVYRALVYFALEQGLDPADRAALLEKLGVLEFTNDETGYMHVLDQGIDVTDLLEQSRSRIEPRVSEFAKAMYDDVAGRWLRELNQRIRNGETVVLDASQSALRRVPHPAVQFYVTAPVDERAQRRAGDLENILGLDEAYRRVVQPATSEPVDDETMRLKIRESLAGQISRRDIESGRLLDETDEGQIAQEAVVINTAEVNLDDAVKLVKRTLHRSEMRNVLPPSTTAEEESLGPLYKRDLLTQQPVEGKIRATREGEIPSLRSMTREEREEYKRIAIELIKQGKIAVAILTGGAGTRMPLDQYPIFLQDVLNQKFNLVKSGQAKSILSGQAFTQVDEMLASLQVTQEDYAGRKDVMTHPEFITKGLIPVVEAGKQWRTFLGLHLYNQYRMIQALGISKDKLPAIVAMGAANQDQLNRFLELTGYETELDILSYTGFPGKRVVATSADVEAKLLGLVKEYAEDITPSIIAETGKPLQEISGPELLQIGERKILARRQAHLAYHAAMDEVKNRLTHEELNQDELNWLYAKAGLLAEHYSKLETMGGRDIRNLLAEIENQIPVRAQEIASSTRPRIDVNQTFAPLIKTSSKRVELEEQIFDLYQFRSYAAEHAGEVLPIQAPRGHGGIFHNTFNDLNDQELILQLIKRGVEYVFYRNIDNTAARLNDDWLVEMGYMVKHDLDMLPEVSLRPESQPGGTLITHEEIEGNPMQIAEDPSLKGTAVDPKKAHFINDAVALTSIRYFTKVYQTSMDELKQIAEIKNPAERHGRLREISNRGFRQYPINPVPKLVRLTGHPDHPWNERWLIGTVFETNMWESTGIETDPPLNVKAMEVGSVEDIKQYILTKLKLPKDTKLTNEKIEHYLESIQGTPAYQEFLDELRWVRFAPTKGWEDYVGINAEIVKILGPQIVEGQLVRSEVRSELPSDVKRDDDEGLGRLYAAGVIRHEPVQGNIRAVQIGEIPVMRSFTDQERGRYKKIALEAIDQGKVAVEILAGGAGVRMSEEPPPPDLAREMERQFALVQRGVANDITNSQDFGQKDEMLISLQATADRYSRQNKQMKEPEFATKPLTPVEKVDGAWRTFLGLHLYNQYRFMEQLGISKRKLPAIVAMNVGSLDILNQFMDRAGFESHLDILKYAGASGNRVVATVEDVDNQLKGLIRKYLNEMNPPPGIVPSGYAGKLREGDLLEVVHKVTARWEAYLAYREAMKHILDRFSSEQFDFNTKNWLFAKAELLIENYSQLADLTGSEIRDLLGNIERQIPERAQKIAAGVHVPIDVLKTLKDMLEEKEAYRTTAENQIADISEFRSYAAQHAGELLKIPTPRGHGGIFHNLFNDETNRELILELIDRGVEYIFSRNIDNTAARLDEDWLVLVGYTIGHQVDMLMEVSRRPKGQAGGTIIRRLDRPGQPIQNAEDRSLAGTSVVVDEAPYINNAVAGTALTHLFKVYKTSKDELEQITRIRDDAERRKRLREISDRAKYPITPVPKIVKLGKDSEHPYWNYRWVVGGPFETMMWESTGIETDPPLHIEAIEVGSVADLSAYLKNKMNIPQDQKMTNERVKQYLAQIQGSPAYQEFLDELRWIRFAPTKNWAHYSGINAEVVKIFAPYLANGDLLHRSEARSVTDETYSKAKELIRSGTQVQVKEIDHLGFQGEEKEFLTQQLIQLNTKVEGSEDRGREIAANVIKKKEEGAKLFVAFIDVEGVPVILGQGLLIGNFDRFDATLTEFQGLGIGTLVTQARMEEALRQGHLSFVLYVKKNNQRAIDFQRGLFNKVKPRILEARKELLVKHGIKEAGEPFVTEEETVYPGDETKEPMILFTYHFVDQATERTVVSAKIDLQPAWREKIQEGKVRNVGLDARGAPYVRPFIGIEDQTTGVLRGGVVTDDKGKVGISTIGDLPVGPSRVEIKNGNVYDKNSGVLLGKARVDHFRGKKVGRFVAAYDPSFGGKPSVNRTDWVPHDEDTCPFCKTLFKLPLDELQSRMVHYLDLGEAGTWAGFYQFIAINPDGHHLWLPYNRKTGEYDQREQKIIYKDVLALVLIPRRVRDVAAVVNDVGATVNHSHLQTISKSKEEKWPVETYQRRTQLKGEAGVDIFVLNDYPGAAFVYKGKDPVQLARTVYQDIAKFYEQKIPVEAISTEDEFYLFPVKRIIVEEFPHAMMGSTQRAGIFPVLDRQVYDQMTSAVIRTAIKKGSTPKETALSILSRSEARGSKSQNRDLRQRIAAKWKKIDAAVKDPSKDVSLIVVAAHPDSDQEVKNAFRALSGKAYHPAVKHWVGVSPGRGSVSNSILALDEALKAEFGNSYDKEMLEENRVDQIAIILGSGYGNRMEPLIAPRAHRSKFFVTLPGGKNFLEFQLQRRFQNVDKRRKGVWIYSVDGFTQSQYPIPESLGNAGIQVFGKPMQTTVSSVKDLGISATTKPFQKGAQSIDFAREKATQEEIQRFQREGKLEDYVMASDADYFLSWEAYFWLLDQVKRMPQTALGSERTILRYNWFEHLFEAATSEWENFSQRYLEPYRGQVNEGEFERLQLWYAHVFSTAKQAREKFGIEFVNLGPFARYHNINRADQYLNLLLQVRSDPVLQEMLNTTLVAKRRFPDALLRYEGKLIDPTVIIDSEVVKDQIGDAVILGYSLLGKEILIDNHAGAVNVVAGFGGHELFIDEGALVADVIALDESIEARPGTVTTQYLIRAKDGSPKLVLVSLPIDIDLRAEVKKIEGEKVRFVPIDELKVFPRTPQLANQIPSAEEEGPDKYSLRELRKLIDRDLTDKIFNQYLPAAMSDKTKKPEQVFAELKDMLSAKRSEARIPEAEHLPVKPGLGELGAAVQEPASYRMEAEKTELFSPKAGAFGEKLDGEFAAFFENALAERGVVEANASDPGALVYAWKGTVSFDEELETVQNLREQILGQGLSKLRLVISVDPTQVTDAAQVVKGLRLAIPVQDRISISPDKLSVAVANVRKKLGNYEGQIIKFTGSAELLKKQNIGLRQTAIRELANWAPGHILVLGDGDIGIQTGVSIVQIAIDKIVQEWLAEAAQLRAA